MNKLANTNKVFSKQGLGCMSMSEFYGDAVLTQKAIELICTAYHQGINQFDTADMYGFGDNEKLVGQAISMLKRQGVEREKIILATKCGIVRDKSDVTKRGINNSYDYIKSCCSASLERLGGDVGYIDLYYIHRIADQGKKIDEAMQAMAELLQEGKIKAVGLSEATESMIREANSALLRHTEGKHQLAAIQSEYSLMTRLVEQNRVLATCRELNIVFVAYSPLSRALLTGEINHVDSLKQDDFRRHLPRFQQENLSHNLSIVDKVKNIAVAKQCSPAQLSLAWLLSKANVVPIPGTTKEKHLLANIAAEKMTLTEQEIALLDNLEQPKGSRYTEQAMKAFGFNSEMKVD